MARGFASNAVVPLDPCCPTRVVCADIHYLLRYLMTYSFVTITALDLDRSLTSNPSLDAIYSIR